jgi:hypothetical protein
MRNIQILILIVLIGISSCSNNKKTKIKKKHYSEKINNEKYKRIWIEYKYPNNIRETVEAYLTKEKDTIFNQYKTYKNGKLDSTKSRFYELNLKKIENTDIYEGKLRYYSENESNQKNINEMKTLSLSIFQKSKDSFYFQTFESKASNEIKFKLINFEDNQLVGIMTESRVIENNKAGKDMVDVITTQIPVDNKRNTHNMAIEVYKIK